MVQYVRLLCLITCQLILPLQYLFIIVVKSKDLEGGSSSADNVEAGTAVFLMELEEKRAIKAGDYKFQPIKEYKKESIKEESVARISLYNDIFNV